MPYYLLYTETLNPHVHESYRSVIRRARAFLKDKHHGADWREQRRAFYRAVIFHHFQARRVVASMGGL